MKSFPIILTLPNTYFYTRGTKYPDGSRERIEGGVKEVVDKLAEEE
jgi:hypothetical protein